MKEVKCDYCNHVLAKDVPRIKSTVTKWSTESGAHVKSIVFDTMDFCNVDCLSNFMLERVR